MMKSPLRIICCIVVVILCTDAVAMTWGPSREEVISQIEKERRERAVVQQQQIGGALAIPVFIFIAITLLGGVVVEGMRSFVVNRFQLSPGKLMEIALKAYLSLNGLILLILLGSENLQRVAVPVLSLLVATAFPFFVTFLPALEDGNKAQTKVALSQIKSFYLVVLVLYIVMQILSPQGFGPIQPK